MTISKEIKDKAQEIGRRIKASKVWVNVTGEEFSEEQYAKASVGGDKEKFAGVEITAEVKERATNDLGSVQDVLVAIEAADSGEAVQAIIDAELSGKNRKTVLEAADKKLKTINPA